MGTEDLTFTALVTACWSVNSFLTYGMTQSVYKAPVAHACSSITYVYDK